MAGHNQGGPYRDPAEQAQAEGPDWEDELLRMNRRRRDRPHQRPGARPDGEPLHEANRTEGYFGPPSEGRLRRARRYLSRTLRAIAGMRGGRGSP